MAKHTADDEEIPVSDEMLVERAMQWINSNYLPCTSFEDCTDPVDFTELFFRLNQNIVFPAHLKIELYDALTSAGFKTETANNERVWLMVGR